MPVPARFTWAAEMIDAAPTDNILEIGCGAGFLVGQLAVGLTTGTVTGLDKSAAMIARAAKRNEALITAKRVKLFTAGFCDASLSKSGFDKIMAFNVNFFWKIRTPELALVKKHLKPGGKLFVFHQAPTKGDRKTVPTIISALEADDWTIVGTKSKVFAPAPAHAVIAER